MGNVYSQKQGDETKLEKKFEQIKTERLKRIRRELVQLQSNIFLAKKKISEEQDLVIKLKLESELEKLQEEASKSGNGSGDGNGQGNGDSGIILPGR